MIPGLCRPDGGLRDARVGLRQAPRRTARPTCSSPSRAARPLALQLHRLPAAQDLRLRPATRPRSARPASRPDGPHARGPALADRGRARAASGRSSCPGMPRFTGGAVGFISYEYIDRIEPTVPAGARDELRLPLVYFMLSDTLLIFDRAKQTLRLCVNAHVAGGRRRTRPYYGGRGGAQHALRRSSSSRARSPRPRSWSRRAVEVPPGNFTRARVREAGREREGVHPRRRHHPGRALPAVLAAVHQDARSTSTAPCGPSTRRPYMFILDTGDYALVGRLARGARAPHRRPRRNPAPSRARAGAAPPTRRTWRSRRSSWPTKRSAPST